MGPARLNKKHPLARFVAFMFSAAQGTVDLSTGSPATLRAASSITGSARGAAMNFDGTASTKLEFNSGNSRYNLLGDITILYGGNPTDFVNYRTIVSKQGAGSSTANIPFESFFTITNGQPNLVRANASNQNSFLMGTAATAGAYNTVGFSQAGGINITPVGVLNGTVQTVTPFVNVTTGPTGNTDALRVGQRVDGATIAKGYTSFVIVLSRALSAAQMLALLADPYQLLEPVTTNWKGTAPTAKLRRNSSLSGLGASGPFFHDPLAV